MENKKTSTSALVAPAVLAQKRTAGPRWMLEHLDKEHQQRISEISKSCNDITRINPADIISSKEALRALAEPKVVLPAFRGAEIYANYPIAHRLFVQICPDCLKAQDLGQAEEILKSSDIVPILLGGYAQYPDTLISTIIAKPHLSLAEFRFYRTVHLLLKSDQVACRHCITKEQDAILKSVKRHSSSAQIADNVKSTIYRLHPFVAQDLDLVKLLRVAVGQNDVNGCIAVSRACNSIQALRTYQALESRYSLDNDDLQSLKNVRYLVNEADGKENSSLMPELMQPFSLTLKPGMNPSDFFEIAGEYRDELSAIVDQLVQGSAANKSVSATELTARFGELSADMAKLKSSKRFLAYRASFGFVKSNSALIGTAIVAGTIGLAGSLIGCGTAIAGGVIGKILRAKGKLKASPETHAFLNSVKKSMRPEFHRILASYTGISLPAVQLYEISAAIEARIKSKQKK